MNNEEEAINYLLRVVEELYPGKWHINSNTGVSTTLYKFWNDYGQAFYIATHNLKDWDFYDHEKVKIQMRAHVASWNMFKSTTVATTEPYGLA